MTALVTGATGFVGGHLVRALLARGREVRCLVREGSARTKGAALASLGAELALGDMGDLSSLRRAVEGASVIFHAAAMLKVPWRQAFYEANVGGTEAIARAAAESGARPTLVVVSSMAAAGPAVPEGGLAEGGGARPRSERDRPAPVSRYGEVKLAAEEAALTHAGRLPITILRPPMVFGPEDTVSFPLFRAASRGLAVAPTRARAALSLIHVEDLASALILAAESGERAPARGENGAGVYHAAAAEALTLIEMGEEAGRALGAPRVRAIRLPSALTFVASAIGEAVGRLRDEPSFLNLDKYREGTAGSFTCDTAKIRALGFAPKRSARERLAETARWYREAGWL